MLQTADSAWCVSAGSRCSRECITASSGRLRKWGGVRVAGCRNTSEILSVFVEFIQTVATTEKAGSHRQASRTRNRA
jgi:hypothetical protein